MGLFDFLKKKDTSINESEDRVASLPNNDTKENNKDSTNSRETMVRPMQSPTPQSLPTQEERLVPSRPSQRQEHSQSQRPLQNRSLLQWPRYGDSASGLISSQQFKVFLCASFVKHPNFKQFAQDWSKAKSGAFSTRFLFIPVFEMDKLNDTEKQAINPSDVRFRDGKDWLDCLRILKEKNLNWNIILLTADDTDANDARSAAKQTGCMLRFYEVDDNGKLKSAAKDPSPFPKPSSLSTLSNSQNSYTH